MTDATTAERLVARELLDPRGVEVWTADQLPEGVAALIVPHDHLEARSGSKTYHLPRGDGSGVRSGSE